MSYLARLKALDQGKGATPPTAKTDKSPLIPPSVSFVSSIDGPFPQTRDGLPADLRGLIERIAARFQCLPDELREMIDLAIEKPEICQQSYEATARAEGLR